MVAVPWLETQEFEHFVQFCETDEFLVSSAGKFISDGLMQGDICLALATEIHRDGFDEYLKAQGLAVSVARARDQYISLDAASTLSQIMVDGSIDPTSFYAVIGEIIQQAVKRSRNVRVFGELVALLWTEGKRAAAIRLEELRRTGRAAVDGGKAGGGHQARRTMERTGPAIFLLAVLCVSYEGLRGRSIWDGICRDLQAARTRHPR